MFTNKELPDKRATKTWDSCKHESRDAAPCLWSGRRPDGARETIPRPRPSPPTLGRFMPQVFMMDRVPIIVGGIRIGGRLARHAGPCRSSACSAKCWDLEHANARHALPTKAFKDSIVCCRSCTTAAGEPCARDTQPVPFRNGQWRYLRLHVLVLSTKFAFDGVVN
jgi:hypothetical protein